MCTQVIHYPMYLYAYGVIYDIHCLTHGILINSFHQNLQLMVIIVINMHHSVHRSLSIY